MLLVPWYLLLIRAQFLLQVTCGPKSTCPECGDKWGKVNGDRFCYYQVEADRPGGNNFDEWLQYCQRMRATLPILKTEKDRENFKSFADPLQFTSVHIGLNRSDTNTAWMWLDKTECTFEELKSFVLNDPRDIPGPDWELWGPKYALRYWKIKPIGFYTYETTDYAIGRDSTALCQKQCPITTMAPTTAAKHISAQGGGSGLGTWGIIAIILAIGAVLQVLLVVYAVLVMKSRSAAGGQAVKANEVDPASNASLTIPNVAK